MVQIMPSRLSITLSNEQAEFLEQIKQRHGLMKSQYISSLIKVEMEKGEDRLRPILSIRVASDGSSISRSPVESLSSPSLPPVRVPFGTKSATIGDIMDINAEMKQVFARRKVKQRV